MCDNASTIQFPLQLFVNNWGISTDIPFSSYAKAASWVLVPSWAKKVMKFWILEYSQNSICLLRLLTASTGSLFTVFGLRVLAPYKN